MLELAFSKDRQIELARKHYLRGNVLLANGQLELAENDYKQCLAMTSDGTAIERAVIADIYHNLGMIAEERRDSQKALGFYHKALNYDDTHSMTWFFIAKLYLSRYEQTGWESDYNSGIKALEQAEQLEAGFPALKFLKHRYATA